MSVYFITDAEEECLYKMFEPCGAIISIKIPRKNTVSVTGTAYLTFKVGNILNFSYFPGCFKVLLRLQKERMSIKDLAKK